MTADDQRDEFEFPDSWVPEPGETLRGTIVSISGFDAGYGEYPIVTLELKDGSMRAVHAFHTVLKAQLAERGVQRGDEVVIRYVGKVATKDGKGSYHSYKVAGGQEREYDWSKTRRELGIDEPAPAPAVPDAPIDMADLPQPASLRQVPVPNDDDDDLPF